MAGDVLVVGDLLVDVVAVMEGPLERASDVGARIEMTGGGSAANTACWLAEAGAPVRLVAAVGDDVAGRTATAGLRDAGVAFAGAVLPDLRTGTCVVLVDPAGERTMLPDRAANDALPPAVVRAALDDRPAWLHLSAYTLLHEGSRPAALAALDGARLAGVPVSVDASSAAPLRAVGAGRFLDWVAGIDVLLANDDELAALGGLDACRTAARVVVAKHGPAGASWHDGAEVHEAPAVPTAVVDTVGAGDALNAGVVAALVAGQGPADALEAGTALAARAVATRGARPR